MIDTLSYVRCTSTYLTIHILHRSLCNGIFGLLHGESGNKSNGNSGQRILDAPVQMKDIGGNSANGQEEPAGSIWIQKIEDNLVRYEEDDQLLIDLFL